MPTLFDPAQRQKQISRIKKLQPGTQPAWGRLTAGNLLPHLADPIRTAMGEIEVPAKSSFLSSKFGSWLIIYGIRQWPKSSPTSPKYDTSKDGRKGTDFDKDMAELIGVIERFAAMPPGTQFKTHPGFGNLSRKTWGYLMNKHIEHHLRQFGL